MLMHISIRHFAIVDNLNLDFHNGLHVLTGETGAGKSIWIDAIQIGLGERADTSIIFPGEKNCDITLSFDLTHHTQAKKWLAQHDIPNDECIIRRIIELDKNSRTTINGIPVLQQWVRELASLILCVHGQHQQQLLLKNDYQRRGLDIVAKNQTLLQSIETIYDAWFALDEQYQTLLSQSQNKKSDLTLYQYQLDELQNAQIQENEYEKLFSEYQMLHQTKEFSATLSQVITLLNSDEAPAAIALTHRALNEVNRITAKDTEIDRIKILLNTAAINLDEASDALESFCNNIDFSGEKLAACEKRLTLLQDLARKHHAEPDALPAIEKMLIEKITQLNESENTLQKLSAEKQNKVAAYQKIADTITKNRKKAADALSKQMTDSMQRLGMKGGKLMITLEKNNTEISRTGSDNVQFLIATNPGQTPHALSQIVSGGELSRLSLILQLLTTEKTNTPTFIFDEVDTGIGGKTADLVGELLRELALSAQVLCVTHLPQVAAKAAHHFKAEKKTEKNKTATTIQLLNPAGREKELARMLSGATITEKSLEHAKELLTQ